MTMDHPARRSLLIAAGYLLLTLTIKELGRHAVIGAETADRLMGMLMGALAVIAGNQIPKKLVPLASLTCDPARDQVMRRFCGRALVLGGLGYMLAFALAPAAIAATLAICLLAPAVVAVGVVAVRCALNRRRAG